MPASQYIAWRDQYHAPWFLPWSGTHRCQNYRHSRGGKSHSYVAVGNAPPVPFSSPLNACPHCLGGQGPLRHQRLSGSKHTNCRFGRRLRRGLIGLHVVLDPPKTPTAPPTSLVHPHALSPAPFWAAPCRNALSVLQKEYPLGPYNRRWM